jgi:phage shock protein PspC (stress-responsive transcriptional regulator)
MSDFYNEYDDGNNNRNNTYKRLYRSRTNRTICGVCGGLGEYLNIDPVVVRVLLVVAAFMSAGVAIVGYFIAAVIIPEEA